MLVAAPSGYGKTTLLSQWARTGAGKFGWLTLDARDNDPVVLLTYLAAAIEQIAPIPARVFEGLSAPETAVAATLLPRFLVALDEIDPRGVLIIDELQELIDDDCMEVVDALASNRPPGLTLVLSGQGRLTGRDASLRARGAAFDLEADALRMSEQEAREMLAGAPSRVSDEDVSELVARTEGWPVALYLTGLANRDESLPPAPLPLREGERILGDYIRSEILARLPPPEVDFLTRTSVLERFSASLCDAVLQRGSSAGMLSELSRKQLFLIGLDRSGEWFRYHRLFRQALRAELELRDPGLGGSLLGRAADWTAEHGSAEVAVTYAQQAGDSERVAALVAAHAQGEYQLGHATTVEGWFDWLDEHGAMDELPGLAASAAWFSALRGGADRAERWKAIAVRRSADSRGSLEEDETLESCLIRLLRAMRCEAGSADLLEAARFAFAALPASSPWRPTVMLMLGLALFVNGETAEADDVFDRAVESGTARGSWNAVSIALAERASIAIAAGDWEAAAAHAGQAEATVKRSRMEAYPPNAIVYAVAARVAIHRSDTSGAERLLTGAQGLRPRLTHVLAVFSLQVRLELARAYLAAADPSGARTMLREVEVLLRHGRDFGALQDEIAELRDKLRSARQTAPGMSTLTEAELRVLPLLATQRTFPEIGEQLHLSRYTIKSHAMSIYRKLDVTSRTDAVDRSRELGLL